jgi:hypothetical protein
MNTSDVQECITIAKEAGYSEFVRAATSQMTALEAENKALREALKLAQRYLTHPDVLAITKSMAVRGEVVNERIANLLEG